MRPGRAARCCWRAVIRIRDGLGPTDAGTHDAAASDAALPPKIDISVTGCASLEPADSAAADGGATDCLGPAPLTVRFSPVGSPGLTTFLWRFGDGSPPVSDRAPTHTYALPGRYDVSVTGGAGTMGTVSKTRAGLIVAQTIGVGGACDVDAQCASGLTCVCKAGAGCGPAFTARHLLDDLPDRLLRDGRGLHRVRAAADSQRRGRRGAARRRRPA